MLNEFVARAADLVAALFPFECMQYDFMKRAMLAVLLLVPLTSGTGIQVVNSRMSFFSDAIGHSAFAGLAIGTLLSISEDLTLPLLALIVGFLIMYMKNSTHLSSDTVIGVTFSAVVAFGLAIVSLNRNVARISQSFLFGDILTIDEYGILVLSILLVLYLAFQFFSYNRMNTIAINPQLAAVHRVHVMLYQSCFIALLSIVVISATRAVGVLLVNALLIVPAAAARNFARNTCQTFWFTLLISYVSGISGLLISAQNWADIPAGASIVLCSCAIFIVSMIYSRTRPSKTADTSK